MRPSADDIAARGLTPGLWFMPFAGDHENPFFRPHLDWFVKHEKGEPFEARWGGTSLDMTHPGAREHLRSVVRTVAHEWGYQYFKMDGLWTGTATRLTYVNDGYKDDQIGEAIFHFVPPFEKRLKVNVPAQSCRILAVRAELGRPHSISTSRHVTQGIVDVAEEAWDAETKTLSGTSKVVAGDPYELRIVALSKDSVWQLDAADVTDGAEIAFEQVSGLVRTTIRASASGDMKWSLRFSESAGRPSEPEPVRGLSANAELFEPVWLSWERCDGHTYEVRRDEGEARIVHGSAWCDVDTEDGRSYGYTVTAVDWLGQRSDPAQVTATTPKRPELGPRPPKPDVSLTSLKPVEARTGWGRVGIGKSAQGLPLRIGDQTFADGIGLHANARVVYARDPAYRRFVAVVGIDEAKRSNDRTSLVCRAVSAHDRKRRPLAASPVLRFGQVERWHFDVALPDDCQQIILIVGDAGDGINSDHADWVDAGFVTRDP